MLFKVCSKCKKFLPAESFWKKKSTGCLRSYCKSCFHLYRKEEKHKLWMREYNIKNRKRIAEYKKKNLERTRPLRNRYLRERRAVDIQFKKSDQARSMLNKFISNGGKSSLIGCSSDELKKYIESKFKDGMSWDNRNKWQIDHIIPLISFDLSVEEEFKKAVHYTNLQPLWNEENAKKGRYERAIYLSNVSRNSGHKKQ